MKTTARARYTLQFKQEAVRLVEGGQSIAVAARTLGLVERIPGHGRTSSDGPKRACRTKKFTVV